MSNKFNVRHYKVNVKKDKNTNKFIKASYLAVVMPFLLCLVLLDKTHCYKEELDNYKKDNINEQKFIKKNAETKYYYNEESEITVSKEIAASKLTSCIKEKQDLNSLPEKVKDKINKLNSLYNENSNYYAFLYKDIYTGFTVSYNEEAPIFTASTIKAPAMIYLYEMASENKINLNEELTYDGSFYSDGSGVLKTKEKNTKYSIDTLIQYAIHDSDNIAYAMLVNRYGRENILNFWKEKGTKNIYTYNTIWGITSASDASIYMNELYNFYINNDTYGDKLMTYFKNAEWKQIKDKNGNYNTANKGGWCDETFHDIAIVFDENPYILIVLSTAGNDISSYNHLFNETSKLAGELHTSYWENKINECNKIKQY